MALLRYLKKKSELPDDKGRLSKAMPSHLIQAANDSISAELERSQTGKRGSYQKISAEMKVKMAKYASTNGIAATIWKYPQHKLKESTLRGWKNLYHTESFIVGPPRKFPVHESFPPRICTTPRSAKVFPRESFVLYGIYFHFRASYKLCQKNGEMIGNTRLEWREVPRA